MSAPNKDGSNQEPTGYGGRFGLINPVIWLASRDFVAEWRMSSCLVLGLTAVLAPLFVLFGLKFGLVDTLRARLIEDPRTREIRNLGSGRFKQDWIETMRSRSEVGFMVPRTRSLAAAITLATKSGKRLTTAVEVIPTGVGDPLFQVTDAVPEDFSQIALSARVARKLKAEPGDALIGIVHRRRGGRAETARLEFRVVAVLAEARFSRLGAWLTVPLLAAIEDFKDGQTHSIRAGPGDRLPDKARVYAGFRLYARSIDDVASLGDLLAELGIEARMRTAEIETVKALDRNLSTVFWLIAVIGSIGYLLSLGANLWANIERKRKPMGLLRLFGMPNRDMVLFPMFQAAMTGLIGCGLAGIVYLVIAGIINGLFQDDLKGGELVCRLLPLHFVSGLALTLVFGVAAAALAAYRACHIDPAEAIRGG